MKAGDRMVFTKSGNEVDLLSFSGGLWNVERADTRKGMACPPESLVTPAEWARMCGE